MVGIRELVEQRTALDAVGVLQLGDVRARVSGLHEMYRMRSKRRVSSQVSGSIPARGGSTNTVPNS
jgi:hypothetical protein